jgi:type VI secretion system protein ImpM
MPISFMPARDALPQYAVFGKLPRRADFVRINAGHPVVRELDELLANSLAFASQQTDWHEETYLNAAASDIQFISSDARWCFCGVLQPSHDEAGRLYPLVGGIVLPAHAVVPHCAELSIANELFYAGLRDQLASAADNAVEMLACQHFLETQAAQNPHAKDDLSLAEKVLERHMRQTPSLHLQTTLDDAGFADLDAHLLAFAFHSELVRRHGDGIREQTILLPLSGQPGEDVLDQAVWLTFYLVALGKWRNHFPSFVGITRDKQRYLAIAPKRFDERFIAGLWGITPAPESILNVGAEDAPWRQHPARTVAAYILERQLQDPAFNLAALRLAIERIAASVTDRQSSMNYASRF